MCVCECVYVEDWGGGGDGQSLQTPILHLSLHNIIAPGQRQYILMYKSLVVTKCLSYYLFCETRLAKRREILIFPGTAGNTGNSREILVIPGNYWGICPSPIRKF